MPDGTASIAVDANAIFTFQLHAPGTGSYTERYDIRAEGDGGIPYSGFWFDYWDAGSMDSYRINITVNHCC